MEYFIKCDSLAAILHEPKLQAVARHNIGTIKMGIDQYDEALTYLNTAKDIRKQLIKEFESDNNLIYDLSSTLANIARVYECLRDINAANQYYNEAIVLQEELYLRQPARYSERLANTYNSLAAINHHFNDLDKASVYYQKAIEILSEKYNQNPYIYMLLTMQTSPVIMEPC